MQHNAVINDFASRCAEKGDSSAPCVLRVRLGGTSRSATDVETHELPPGWTADDVEAVLSEVAEEAPAAQRAYIDARKVGATSAFARCVLEPTEQQQRVAGGERISEARMAASLGNVIAQLLGHIEGKDLLVLKLVKETINAGSVAAMATAQLQVVESNSETAYFKEVAALVAPMLGPVATKLLATRDGKSPTANKDPGATFDRGLMYLASIVKAHPEILTDERKATLGRVLSAAVG